MDTFLEEMDLLFLVEGGLIPGGGMPIGIPQVGGSPIGGPMGDRIPGGRAIIPRGGVARPTGVGAVPHPGGY